MTCRLIGNGIITDISASCMSTRIFSVIGACVCMFGIVAFILWLFWVHDKCRKVK